MPIFLSKMKNGGTAAGIKGKKAQTLKRLFEGGKLDQKMQKRFCSTSNCPLERFAVMGISCRESLEPLMSSGTSTDPKPFLNQGTSTTTLLWEEAKSLLFVFKTCKNWKNRQAGKICPP